MSAAKFKVGDKVTIQDGLEDRTGTIISEGKPTFLYEIKTDNDGTFAKDEQFIQSASSSGGRKTRRRLTHKRKHKRV
jgi:hypothetical protein